MLSIMKKHQSEVISPVINKVRNLQSKQTKMDPQDFINHQDLSMSMIQPQPPSSPKKLKTHSSFSVSGKKNNTFDSFSYDTYQQPPTQNNSKEVSESQSITQSGQSSPDKKRMRDLFVLQEQLQKQFLMMMKEKQQKVKFLSQIEEQIKNYYALLIETRQRNSYRQLVSNPEPQPAKTQQPNYCTKNKIVPDNGFDNCYNFIKEVIITASKNYDVAVCLLMNCTISYRKDEKGSIFVGDYLCLVDLFVNVLYEGLTETDPFLKDVTKLICCLLAKLPDLMENERQTLLESAKFALQTGRIPQIKTNYEKIHLIFNVYMQKQQVQDYFDILSNHMLKKVEKISFNRAQNRSRTGVSLHQSRSIIDTEGSIDLEKEFMDPGSSFGFKLQQNWLEYLKPFESFNDQKRALAMSYLSQIYSQADLCPMNLKIVLKYFYESQFNHFLQKYPLKMKHQIKQLTYLKVWQLIEGYYLKGFDQSNQHKNMLYKQMSVPEIEILKDVVRMVKNFFGNRKEYGFYEDDELVHVYRKSKKFIAKVVEKLLSFNEEKYNEFKEKIEEQSFGMKEVQLKKNYSEVCKPMNQFNTPTKPNMYTQKTILTPSQYLQSSITPRAPIIDIQPTQNHPFPKIQLPPQLLRIYGGCISLKQLHILLTSLKRIVSTLNNQRIINRVNRIFDMSPQLQFISQHKLVKHPNQVQHLYIILSEHELDQMISTDYKKLYDKEYLEDKVKNMIRAVMCELKLKELSFRVNKRELVNKKKVNIREFQLEDFKMFKKNRSPQKGKQLQTTAQPAVLMNLLQKISTQCSRSVQGTEVEFSLHKGVSIQLLKKIKYLLYLFQDKSSELNEPQVLKEMLEEVRYRSSNMIQIYEHTKFGLLAAVGNVKHYKNLLISKKEIQQKVNSRIKHIKMLESLHLNICLTSPYTRSHPEFSLRDNSPSKQSSHDSSSFISAESPRKPTSGSFTKQKPSMTSDSSSKKEDPTKQPSTIFFQPYNKYKYRISNADDIVLCETSECIHKDNIFLGLSYHVNTIQEFVQMFSNLREVGENLFFARFIVGEDIVNKVYVEVAQKLKHSPPVKHYMATVYLNKKYQKLNYSIDKINSVLYEFIDYLLNERISKQAETKTHSLELRKLIKDIILRGIHQRLVKRIQKKIKVNVGTDQRISLKKKKDLAQGKRIMTNNGVDLPKEVTDLLGEFEDEADIYDSEMVENGDKYDSGAKSAEVDINKQGQIRNRELSRSSRKSRKQTNINQLLMKKDRKLPQDKDSQIDSTVYQSRNDQILLLQMQTIRNSTYFQSYHSNHLPHSVTDSTHPTQTEFNTKQLEEVCARYIKGINKKETPEDKIQLLKNVSDIYKLIVKENKTEDVTICRQNSSTQHNHHHYHPQHHHNTHYNIQTLIFRSLVHASPPNFITNLAFIEMFLHKDKLLSVEGKILNQFKQITQHIFEMKEIHRYLHVSPQTNLQKQTDSINDPQLRTTISKIRNKSLKENYLF